MLNANAYKHVKSSISIVNNILLHSGAGNNLKVEGHKMPVRSAGRKIFDVPLHFSVVPLHVRGHYKNRVGTSSIPSRLTMRRAT